MSFALMAANVADPGPSLATTDVDKAIIGALRTWYSTWLRIESRNRGLAKPLAIPDQAAYASSLDTDDWLDRWAPAVLVTTSKTTGRPMRHADSTYEAAWDVAVSVIVRGTTPSETRDRASIYEVALRNALGHRNVTANAGGIIHAAYWQGSEIAPVANVNRQGRYLAAGMTTFNVITDSALKDSGGPISPVPDPDPLPDYVTGLPVTDVVVDVEGLTPNEPLGG